MRGKSCKIIESCSTKNWQLLPFDPHNACTIRNERQDIEGEGAVIHEDEVIEHPFDCRENNDDLKKYITVRIEEPGIHAGGNHRKPAEKSLTVHDEAHSDPYCDKDKLHGHREA